MTNKDLNIWDFMWENYEEINTERLLYYEENSVRFKQISSLVKQHFKDRKPNVLEFGSGRGLDSILLSEYAATITLFDYSQAPLNYAEKILLAIGQKKGKYKLLKGDCFEYKKYIDMKFDIVMSNGTAEHFKDEERNDYIKYMYELTNPGGMVIITTPYKYSLPHTLYKYFAVKFKTWVIPEEINFSKREYKNILNNLCIKDKHTFLFGSFYTSIKYNIAKPLLKFVKININFPPKTGTEKSSILDRYFGNTLTLVVVKKHD